MGHNVCTIRACPKPPKRCLQHPLLRPKGRIVVDGDCVFGRRGRWARGGVSASGRPTGTRSNSLLNPDPGRGGKPKWPPRGVRGVGGGVGDGLYGRKKPRSRDLKGRRGGVRSKHITRPRQQWRRDGEKRRAIHCVPRRCLGSQAGADGLGGGGATTPGPRRRWPLGVRGGTSPQKERGRNLGLTWA